ncbi:MAG: translocation/assembly module TamB domain-containing protein [Akkermansiaceae bacterium]
MSEKTQPTTPPKKRKWKRRLAWCAVVLLCLALAVNGPIARHLIHHFTDQALTDQGMNGDLKVTGSISSGFTIENLDYSGDQGIQSLSIKQAHVDYKLLELLDFQIRKLDISEVSAVIDITKFPQQEKSPSESSPDTLSVIRPIMVAADIDIRNLHVTLLQGTQPNIQPLAQFEIGGIAHTRGSDTFQLSQFLARDATAQSTPSQDIQITWKDHSATLPRMELLPKIALEDVDFNWSAHLHGTAKLQLYHATFNVDMGETLTARLSHGELDSETLNQRFDLGLPARLTVSKFKTHIENWHSAIPDWEITSSLTLKNIIYQDQKIDLATITFTQEDQGYRGKITSQIDGSEAFVRLKGQWTSPTAGSWWLHTTAEFDASLGKASQLARKWLPAPDAIHLTKASLTAVGTATLNGQNITAHADAKLSGIVADKTSIPELSLTANYASKQPITAKITSPTLQASIVFDQDKQTYSGKLHLDETNPTWLNALASAMGQNIRLANKTQLTWSGRGNLSNEHQGSLKLGAITVNLPDTEPITARAEANYHWPNNLNLTSLQLQEGEWTAHAALHWDGKLVRLPKIEVKNLEETVASISGSTPYQAHITTPQKFLAQEQPWSLTIASKPITFKRLRNWLPLEQLKNLTGNSKVNLKLSGSPHAPILHGDAHIHITEGLGEGSHDPVSLALNLASEGAHLNINGNLSEKEIKRITLKAKIPFTPSTWAKSNDIASTLLKTTTLEGEASIHTLPLARFSRFIPQLDKITGTLSADAKVSGTLEKPKYQLDLKAHVPSIKLNDFDYGEIRNVQLSATINESNKAHTTTTAEINGGKFQISGDADISDLANPSFNAEITTRYALVHRDDLMSIRANTDLKVNGTLDQATVSGTIGIAESLVYKDINLIPIGVPSTEVAKVKLPAIDAAKANDALPVPKPFANWKLDLTLKTDDPILLRGNIATGNVQGKVHVGGTASQPKLNGSFYANKIKAKLPFSVLTIPKGEVKFSPKNGIIPTLNVRGKSRVGEHDVSIFIFGSASSPKTAFTSFPPLPEHEVLTLLATGTTTGGLANRDVATFKAFQLFLHQMKQRADKPGGNKLFRAMLEGTEDLNLKVGEVDPFTGRKFSSATVEVRPRWHLTAQVDNLQETRGLIVYVIRFQ